MGMLLSVFNFYSYGRPYDKGNIDMEERKKKNGATKKAPAEKKKNLPI